MDAPEMTLPLFRKLLALASVAVLAATACAPQAAAPTAAPAQPAPTAAPAKPAPTAAPATAAAPTAKPAATAAPAAKPTEKPAAKPAFDEKAVADFYKGKTIRIVVGFGPGGATDTIARLLQKVLPKYIPGSPSVVVENKPGAGSLLAANTVYNSEPKDGTVVVAPDQTIVQLQAIGAQGVQFDVGKLNWLASSTDSIGTCAVRTDSGITRIQDIMEGGKELVVSSFGKGTVSYDPPAAMNAALGTRFKLVTGYESGAAQRLAVQNKEVQGFCASFDDVRSPGRELFEGSNPVARVIVVTGDTTPDHPFLKGVPAAETLAKSEEARTLLKVIQVPFRIRLPQAVVPEVPQDRVQALRRAYDKAYADPEVRDAAEKAQIVLGPKTGEEVTRIVRDMLNTPPATLAKLKQALE